MILEERKHSLALNEKISPQRVYEIGAACVKEKTEKALKLYNRMMPDFCCYGNQCLYDTFVKGLPEFFRWYDVRFDPQNTILEPDYLVLKDISGYTGIDKIYEFIQSVCLEEKFLSEFPVDYITNILSAHNCCWKESADNICETVRTHIITHIFTGESLEESALENALEIFN